MGKIKIKLHRYANTTYGSYGPDFEARLAGLGWRRQKRPFKLLDSKIQVTTHEDGSEIIGALPEIMKYIGYVADLAAVWFLVKGVVKRERRTIRITLGRHTYEGVPRDDKEARSILSFFSKLDQ